jgi:hypothetical protein
VSYEELSIQLTILKRSVNTHVQANKFVISEGTMMHFCLGWGANPSPLDLIYFLIFHHFTAEPQRLPAMIPSLPMIWTNQPMIKWKKGCTYVCGYIFSDSMKIGWPWGHGKVLYTDHHFLFAYIYKYKTDFPKRVYFLLLIKMVLNWRRCERWPQKYFRLL